MRTNWEPKIIGIMQSSADKTLQIAFDHTTNKVEITGGSIDEPAVFNQEEFGRMTVHEILSKAGVPIDENAGK